ncbi:MAG: hypothetical protein GY913_21520 [Proteobacteria bacterium]|nr:hypothetical protein [Actinomycetes bacterium]MCP4919489.1 hypothetical protein [Pseudomonadota bacterium]
MPSYTFTCIGGHDVDRFFQRPALRPKAVPCPTCKGDAYYRPTTWTAPEPETKQEGKVLWRGKPPSMALKPFRCQACEHEEIIDIDFDAGETTDPRPCTQCGGEALVQFPKVPRDELLRREVEDGGYYDNGLGQWITDKKHRAAVCKAKGLIPVDGDIDTRAFARAERQRHLDDEAIISNYEDELENHPKFRKYREMRDKGAYDELLADPLDGQGI